MVSLRAQPAGLTSSSSLRHQPSVSPRCLASSKGRTVSCAPAQLAHPRPWLHQPAQSVLSGLHRGTSHVCQARRQDPEDWQSKYQAKRSNGRIDVNVNGQQISISDNSLLLGALGLLALAAILGPLIIGITVAAVSVGAALSVGAFALSFLWLPVAFMFGFMALTFVVPFGAFATLGLGLVLPKLFSLIIAGGGIAIGWFVVQNMLPRRSTATTAGPSPGSSSPRSTSRSGRDDGPVVQAEVRSWSSMDDERLTAEEEEVRRVSQELREFDTMMAEREEQKRVDDWRKRTSGR